MARKLSFGAAAALITALIVLACSDPSGLHSTITLYPENPDSEPYDSDDPYDFPDGVSYMVYANVENTIYRFAIDDSSVDGCDVVAENVDSRNPIFSVSEDNKYIAFTRSTDEDGNSGYFLVVKNLDSDTETYVVKTTSTQSLYREFLIAGNNLVFSNEGYLESRPLASAETDESSVDINQDRTNQIYCSHTLNYGYDGYLTFLEQSSVEEVTAIVHLLPYDASTPEPASCETPTLTYENKVFSSQVYPVNFENRGLMALASPDTAGNAIQNNFGGGQKEDTVLCDDTTAVEFNKIYQTPLGTWNFLYGGDSVYWFKSADRTATGDLSVSGRDFASDIEWIKATPDEDYVLMQDTHGIWVYQYDESQDSFDQLYCTYEWLNQEDEVLWIEITDN